MKLSAKPISSPGRTDKFPPPLMRFLRSNAGSRSRRSRSSPMFVRKKNTTFETHTQEPSSPKVTCMGQVRVKRASKQPTTQPDLAPTRCRRRRRRCCCFWIRRPNNPCLCNPLWPNWPFFRRKPTKLKQDSQSEPNFYAHEESELPFQERVNVDKDSDFASNSSTPPRNALLLTRCRSAPYRSSSLASRFWSSPVKDQETEQQHTSEGPQTEPELGFLTEKIASLTEPEKVEEVETETESVLRPTVLTRCKSEPARTGHRLDPLQYQNSSSKYGREILKCAIGAHSAYL
ncbi:hypothetical protein HKD37_19G054464 [Glycine soja]